MGGDQEAARDVPGARDKDYAPDDTVCGAGRCRHRGRDQNPRLSSYHHGKGREHVSET